MPSNVSIFSVLRLIYDSSGGETPLNAFETVRGHERAKLPGHDCSQCIGVSQPMDYFMIDGHNEVLFLVTLLHSCKCYT
jgi:hypothetical protein